MWNFKHLQLIVAEKMRPKFSLRTDRQKDRQTDGQTHKGNTVNPLLLRRGGGYNQDILSIWKTTTIIFFTLNQNFELMVILKKNHWHNLYQVRQ